MPDPPSTSSPPPEENRQLHDTADAPKRSLFPCPDCEHKCSNFAESCPSCGRFFRRYAGEVTVDRSGWFTTIAGGIIVAWIVVAALSAVLIVVLLALGVGLSSIPR